MMPVFPLSIVNEVFGQLEIIHSILKYFVAQKDCHSTQPNASQTQGKIIKYNNYYNISYFRILLQ